MKTNNTQLESFKLAEKQRLDLFHSEPFQVVVKLEGFPLPIRITYAKEKSERILEIEELDATEQAETSCIFRGRSAIGDGCSYLKELKQAIQGIRPSDWKANHQHIMSYYKQH